MRSSVGLEYSDAWRLIISRHRSTTLYIGWYLLRWRRRVHIFKQYVLPTIDWRWSMVVDQLIDRIKFDYPQEIFAHTVAQKLEVLHLVLISKQIASRVVSRGRMEDESFTSQIAKNRPETFHTYAQEMHHQADRIVAMSHPCAEEFSLLQHEVCCHRTN